MELADLRNALVAAGIRPDAPLLLDSEIALPTRAWVHGAFAADFNSALETLGIARYETEAMDCDKFARIAAAYASIAWAKTHAHSQTGLAFGIVCYLRRDNQGGHCVNVFVYRNGDGRPVVEFVEPQQQPGGRMQQLHLTPEEIASVWAVVI